MKSNDPRIIDMSDPKNLAGAIDRALAATAPSGFGEDVAADLFALAKPDDKLWTVSAISVADVEARDIVCITGNGPTSRANAALFVDAARMVLGLVEEIDRLKTILRVAGIPTG